MATCIVNYRYRCSTETYLRVRRSIRTVRIPKGMVHASPSPLSSYLRRMSRVRLNSSYISTLLKVKVSGSCIIVFQYAIVRISLPLESGSAVEDDYVKQRILFYRRLGKSYVQISRCLSEEGYATTKVGVYKFVK